MLQKLPEAERADVEAKIAARDPLRFAAGLREQAREGRVLMINAAEDEVIPRACTEKLAQRHRASPIGSCGSRGWGITRRWPNCRERCG